jgi:hypothetical protein
MAEVPTDLSIADMAARVRSGSLQAIDFSERLSCCYR